MGEKGAYKILTAGLILSLRVLKLSRRAPVKNESYNNINWLT